MDSLKKTKKPQKKPKQNVNEENSPMPTKPKILDKDRKPVFKKSEHLIASENPTISSSFYRQKNINVQSRIEAKETD